MPVPVEFEAAVGPAAIGGFGGGTNLRGVALGWMGEPENMAGWGDNASSSSDNATSGGVVSIKGADETDLRTGKCGRINPWGSAGERLGILGGTKPGMAGKRIASDETAGPWLGGLVGPIASPGVAGTELPPGAGDDDERSSFTQNP